MSDLSRSHLVRLLRDERGSILPIFAIILLVLIGMIGMGIDYTRASFANAKLQVALDATALALSANAATITSGALTSEANTLFSSIYTGTRLTTPSITATYSNAGGPQIVLTGTATLADDVPQPSAVQVASMNLSASSTIAWGSLGCASRWCSTTPDRCRIRARSARCRRDQEPSQPAQVRGRQHWRRLRLDHSLCEGRPTSAQATRALSWID